MTFDLTKLDPTGSGSKGVGAMGVYQTTDEKATVLVDGYFDTAYQQLLSTPMLLVKASDETFLAQLTVTTGDVAVTEFGTVFGSGLSAASDLGTVGGTSGISMTVDRLGNGMFRANFTLTAVTMTVTDAAGSGSYASTKLLDLAAGAWAALGCRQDYTAFAEGAALTGAVGDAAFEIGVGFAAIGSAADGALGATEDDVGGDVNITLSGGTGTGTAVTGAGAVVDGTGTAADLSLNWSGSAATIDANSTIDVTGTISVILAKLGDD